MQVLYYSFGFPCIQYHLFFPKEFPKISFDIPQTTIILYDGMKAKEFHIASQSNLALRASPAPPVSATHSGKSGLFFHLTPTHLLIFSLRIAFHKK